MFVRSLVLGAMVLVLAAPAAPAEIIVDPLKPFSWKEMLACEQVVVAKYKSHDKDRKLTLEVVRVLKGPPLKPGDTVTVALKHWYSVETGPVGYDKMLDRKAKNNVPKLCYKTQLMNPGDAVPVPVIDDVRQPAIYFLPKADAPA